MKNLFKCDNCDHVTEKRKLKDVGDLGSDYLYPGAIIPTGRCPKCDCGCYPLVLDLANRKTVKAIQKLWDALSDILEEPGRRHTNEQHSAGLTAIAAISAVFPAEFANDAEVIQRTKKGR